MVAVVAGRDREVAGVRRLGAAGAGRDRVADRGREPRPRGHAQADGHRRGDPRAGAGDGAAVERGAAGRAHEHLAAERVDLAARVPDREQDRVAARLRERVVDDAAARGRAVVEVPRPVDELAALRRVGEPHGGIRAERVLRGLPVGERVAGGRRDEDRGGAGRGRRARGHRQRGAAARGAPARDRAQPPRDRRAPLAQRAQPAGEPGERRAVVRVAREPQRGAVAAAAAARADDDAREVAGVAGEQEVDAPVAADDRGAARGAAAVAALEAHADPALERRPQRHAHERAGRRGERLDLADVEPRRDRGVRGGGEEEREREQRDNQASVHRATILDLVHRRQAG